MRMTAYDMPRSYWRKIAKDNGILRDTFNRRIRAGWKPEDAATVATTGSVPTGGAKQLCREAGLHEDSIYKYRSRRDGAHDLTDAEIIERLLAWHERLNISELARQSGIARGTLQYRLKQGWSVERATSTPPRTPRPPTADRNHPWRAKQDSTA